MKIILLWRVRLDDFSVLTVLVEEDLLEVLLHFDTLFALEVSFVICDVDEWILDI